MMNIQYLGHSAFKITTARGVLLIDPYLSGNPNFKGNIADIAADVDAIVLTHGHNDHYGDTDAIIKSRKIPAIACFELANLVSARTGKDCIPFAPGGTVDFNGIKISLVRADHSASFTDEEGRVHYVGVAGGVIIDDGVRRVYHMGDTAIFGDMALIEELHQPDIGIVPMGGHFTMDAKTAALACNRYFNFKHLFPCHYGTFPVLAQNADGFKAAIEKGQVHLPALEEIVTIES